MFEEFDINNKFEGYKTTLLESKKYWIIYLGLILITCLSTVTSQNLAHPKFELMMFFIVAILGIFCIVYYFRHNNDKELYKVAFVVIVCFGLVCSLILPVCEVSDETEHITRAEITSHGVIFPHWTGEDLGLTRTYNITHGDKMEGLNRGAGYYVPQGMFFFYNDFGKTVFTTTHDTDKINYTPAIWYSAFEQNPFFGYLPQAIGIAIAKLLDMNIIWIMWLGRIGNLLCYAGLISYAIKKTPYLKMPLLAVACIPITIYQASSISIDSMIFGLGILAVAYFIYMLKSPKESLDNKEVGIFTLICLLLGLCKLPYLAFIFLLLLVPKDNFKDKKNYIKLILISIIGVAIIGLLWSNYSTPTLLHSWRSYLFDVNSTAQAQYFLSNPPKILEFIQHIFTVDLWTVITGVFNFYSGGTPNHHYEDSYIIITILIELFLAFILFIYPREVKFDKKTKIGVILIMLIIYIGTCTIQLLTWSPVGKIRPGVSIRYFIPLVALIPILAGLPKEYKKEEIDYYSIVLIIGFMATLILAFATKYY